MSESESLPNPISPSDTAQLENVEILLRRQAILDAKRRIFAYQIEFYACNGQDIAHSLLSQALSQFGAEQIFNPHINFVGVTASVLLSEEVLLLPAQFTVLQLPPNLVIDSALLNRCQALKQMGFKLALDDYSPKPEDEPLLALLDYIKLNIENLQPGQLKAPMAQIKKHTQASLIAKNVEQEEDYESCLALGFSLFQGYFFAKPSLRKNHKAQSSQMVIMRIMGMLLSDANVSDLEPLFKDNPSLTIGLLQLVNSVGVNGSHAKVKSLRQAIVVLGQKQLLRWVQLLLYASPDGTISNSLIHLVASRARLMELLAIELQSPVQPFSDQAFMVGMLSFADAVMHMPLDEIFSQIGLADDIKLAVLQHAGQLGSLLALTEKIEQGDFSLLAAEIKSLGLSVNTFAHLQLQAMHWTDELAKT